MPRTSKIEAVDLQRVGELVDGDGLRHLKRGDVERAHHPRAVAEAIRAPMGLVLWEAVTWGA